MIKIIPAIDIIEGQCVRLTQGDYQTKKVYHTNPVEMAKVYADHGITHLHLVDLDGAKAGHIINWKILEAICQQTSLAVDFGGGLQSDEDLKIAFESGANQVTGGSIAVKNKPVFKSWLQKFGGEKIILGADAHQEKIAISGWQKITDINIFDFLEEYEKEGMKYVISTDIQKDGLLQGVSLDLYKAIKNRFPQINLIASGGVSSMQDVSDLDKLSVYGVVVGKALYENKISLEDIYKYHGL